MSLSAVLPLKISGARDTGNLGHAVNLIATLDAFWRGAAPLQLDIYCPAAEVDEVRTALPATPRIALAVRSEWALLPRLALYPRVDGWFKQQALKMAYAAAAPHEFYLTFDADILCIRPFDEASFIAGGRGAVDYDATALHPGWWRESTRLLGLPSPPPERGMTVTPHLFSAAAMRALLARLDTRLAGGWLAGLMREAVWRPDQWTEATLYWLHALDSGMAASAHQPDHGSAHVFHSGIDIWVNGQHDFESWSPAAYRAAGGTAHFVVCQSTAGHDPRAIREKLRPLLTDS